MRDFFCVCEVELSEYVLSSLKSIKCCIMAKIKFGMMMTDARGKLGGQVFSKNRSGAYVRTKVTPANPQTSYQQANRSALGLTSSQWSGLTPSQRTAWNNAVTEWQKTNVFGDLVKPTGKNLFTSLNKVIIEYFPSTPLLVLPPSKTEFPTFSIASASLSEASGIVLISLAGGVSESTNFRVRATPVLSPGTSYVKNQLRSLPGVFNVDETGRIVITTEYASRFGAFSVGGVVGFEVTPVSNNGQLGVPSTIVVPVSA